MRPELQRSVDMSMQVVAFHSRVVLRSIVRYKIKRRLREAVKLIVTRGAAVEESRKGLKIVFRAEDVGADRWIVPGACVSLPRAGRLLIHMSDWTYMALPTTKLFRMPFVEQLDLMRKALETLRRRIPEVEKILRSSGHRDATSHVRTQIFQERFDVYFVLSNTRFTARVGRQIRFAPYHAHRQKV